jgi:small subunit ribosomal protein S20
VAHHASALKQMRQGEKRRARNRTNLSQLKTQVKKLRAAIAEGNAEAAKKGVVHDNAASRYKSRLARKVSALGTTK